MTDPTLALTSHKSWLAQLELIFSKEGQERTQLIHQKHLGPLLVQKTLYPEKEPICHAVILHPPAGIAGGDTLNISISLQSNAQVVITTPGATKWYKSNGHLASQKTDIHLQAQAHLDFLPQENIFFDASNAFNQITIHQNQNSSLIGWDISQLGRTAAGEDWSGAHLKSEIELYFENDLAWVESAQIEAADLAKDFSCALDQFRVMGTMWLSSQAASSELLEQLALNLPWSDDVRIGASRIELVHQHGFILVRGVAKEVENLKYYFINIWLKFRQPISGIAPMPLRLWST